MNTTYKKRLNYLTDDLLSGFLRELNPEWRDLVETYLKYLDEKVYNNIVDITNITNINNVENDALIKSLFEQYGSGIINEQIMKIDNENRKQFAILGKLINNLKGTKSSIDYLNRYLGQAQIFDLQRNYVFEDINYTYLEDATNWEMDTDSPPDKNPKFFKAPFTYGYTSKQVYDGLAEILDTVNPAGVAFDVSTPISTILSSTISTPTEVIEGNLLFEYKYNGIIQHTGANKFTITFNVTPVEVVANYTHTGIQYYGELV